MSSETFVELCLLDRSIHIERPCAPAIAEPGDEILVDANAHIYYYEAGAPAALAGVMCRCLPGVRGVFTVADVEAVLRPADQHFAFTKLVCPENTHNRGRVPRARLRNAAVATGIPERDYAAHFDSVSVCFSKGLGTPAGSALCGTREFIQRAGGFARCTAAA